MVRANLHTHTWRCKHASGDVADYVRAARDGGMRVLGMADHTPLPDGRWRDHRMDLAQLDGYIAAVRAADAAEPAVRVLLGLECDWDPVFAEFYRDELLGRRGFDYLIAGCHFTPYQGDWYSSFEEVTTPALLRAHVRQAEATMASGLFAFITHPDIFGACQARWTADTAAAARDICTAAAALGMPLELNGYGLRKPWRHGRPGYPWDPFWEIAAEAGVEVVLSSDAHRPQDLFAGMDQLAALVAKLGLREAVLPVRGRAA